MRHRKASTKLNKTTSHRNAMMRNMVTSLFEHEKITTTDAKAKALRPLAEKMITLAKRGDLHARRQAMSVITNKAITAKLFSDIKDRYMETSGGYTSLVKVGIRRGDASLMTIIQLTDPKELAKSRKKAAKKKPAKKAAAKAKEETAVEPEAAEELEVVEAEAAAEVEAEETVEETTEETVEEPAEEEAEETTEEPVEEAPQESDDSTEEPVDEEAKEESAEEAPEEETEKE